MGFGRGCSEGGTCSGVFPVDFNIPNSSPIFNALRAAVDGDGLYGPGGTYISGINDTRDYGFLGGYIETFNALVQWAPSSYQGQRVAVPNCGPQYDSVLPWPIGEVTFSVRTGDLPDLSDAGGFIPAEKTELHLDSLIDFNRVHGSSESLLAFPYSVKRFSQFKIPRCCTPGSTGSI